MTEPRRCMRVHEEHGYKLLCDNYASVEFFDPAIQRVYRLCLRDAQRAEVKREVERLGLVRRELVTA